MGHGRLLQRRPQRGSFTADGWFRTGDVVTIQPNGYIEIADRTKDLIKSGGEWISSVALENALMAHPKVQEAAVIAVPDERWAERPLACVVRAARGSRARISEAELDDYLGQQFAKWWLPDRYLFLDELPKTSVGKFDKKAMRQQHAVDTPLSPPDTSGIRVNPLTRNSPTHGSHYPRPGGPRRAARRQRS